MCLPDVISSFHCIGKARGINATQWAVDQRPFIWAAASAKPSQKPQGPLWTAWNDTFHYPGGAPLQAAGIPLKARLGSDEPHEVESSLSLGGSLRASTTTPVAPKEFEILQSKVWEPRPNGRDPAAPAMRSFFGSSPSCAASGVDTLQPSLSREGSVVSCTSSPRISMPAVVQENSQSTKVPTHLIDAWESSRSKEERSRRSSWVEELIEENRMQNATTALKRKFGSNSGSTCVGKTSRITHQKDRHSINNSKRGRPAPKKELSTRSTDVSMSESLSDNEDLSDDDGEGGPAVSEKRRKRMLSNRASAQRSRQRRQERLDTLEVLVAELRVENAALTRRANNAATAAKKFEEENKILRDRLGKQESLPLSDTLNESDKTTENSGVVVNNKKNGETVRLYGGGPIVPTRNHGSSSAYTGETRHRGYSSESSRPSKIDSDDDGAGAENSKSWNNNISSSNFDFEFNADSMEAAAAPYCGGGTLNRAAGVQEGVNVKDLYQSAIMNMAQSHSFQNLDAFGIELEQCNHEMDKKNLDSRSVEDIWLESLANCLK